MEKAFLRKQQLELRKQLSLEEVVELSNQICARFFENFTPEKAQLIHIFLPILKNREINTWLIIHKLWLEFPEVKIAVPVTNFHTQELEHYLITRETEILDNHWGIPEPANAERIAEAEVDMVLMPLLAFDEQGNRVGYGKGYYDKFLHHCRPETIKIGLSLLPPVAKITDTFNYDVPLNYCLTPQKRYAF